MTLDQVGSFLATYPVEAKVVHASETPVDSFRAAARKYLETAGHFVIVNYLRKATGQERGGPSRRLRHMMPIQIRFLILDVSRYKYRPVCVFAAELLRQ
jgi:hypothetical protein